MLKKICITLFLTIICVGLLGGYFFHANCYAGERRTENICRSVNVRILDSIASDIVDKQDLEEMLKKLAVGKKTDSLNLFEIENILDNNGEIAKSQVFWKDANTLGVNLTQRRPVVRFESSRGRFYSDRDGYLFPVLHTIDVPVVTGKIPLNVNSGYRGYADSSSIKWIKDIAEMSAFISSDKYWNRQISQIDVMANRDLVLYPTEGEIRFVFGDASDYKLKFRKIEKYYQHIAPTEKAKRYTVINVKFKNQIICK